MLLPERLPVSESDYRERSGPEGTVSAEASGKDRWSRVWGDGARSSGADRQRDAGGPPVCKWPNRWEPDRPLMSLALVSSTGSHWMIVTGVIDSDVRVSVQSLVIVWWLRNRKRAGVWAGRMAGEAAALLSPWGADGSLDWATDQRDISGSADGLGMRRVGTVALDRCSCLLPRSRRLARWTGLGVGGGCWKSWLLNRNSTIHSAVLWHLTTRGNIKVHGLLLRHGDAEMH